MNCPQCKREMAWYPSNRVGAHPGDGHGEPLYTLADGRKACGDCANLPRTTGERLQQLAKQRSKVEL